MDPVAKATSFNRWLIPVGAVTVHICIGSVYAWSTFNRPIIALFPNDPAWFRPPYTTFTTALVLLGLSAAFGGGGATIPVFLADIFGADNVGAIHGSLLTAWSAAAVTGPVIITELSNHARAALSPGMSKIHNLRDTVAAVGRAAFAGLRSNYTRPAIASTLEHRCIVRSPILRRSARRQTRRDLSDGEIRDHRPLSKAAALPRQQGR